MLAGIVKLTEFGVCKVLDGLMQLQSRRLEDYPVAQGGLYVSLDGRGEWFVTQHRSADKTPASSPIIRVSLYEPDQRWRSSG